MNKANNTSWQRLESVIRWANMTTNHFGRHIGLARSEPLYQIKSGIHGISQALAGRIVEKFPELSKGWLLTGEGDMFGRVSQTRTVPFYEGDIFGGIEKLKSAEPRCHIDIPLFEECDFAYRSSDEAMAEDVMVGTIVFLKETDTEAIISGGLYVIVCANYVILRRVRVDQSHDARQLRLETSNPKYDNTTIDESQVMGIYRVVGNLKLY